MKLTTHWLNTHLETDATLEQISETLTNIGLEVEEITDHSVALAPFVIARILETAPHPDADKLQICQVSNGTHTLQIVCGAPNARAGINVVLAPVGSLIPTNGMKIKASKIRGVESHGMLCSANELGLGEDSAGIMELPEDAPIGKQFASALGYDDAVIEIAITPNRGDCLGVYGIARDLAAAGLGTLTPLSVTPIDAAYDCPISVQIDDPDTTLFIGRHFKVDKNSTSPDWLQQRLTAIGITPKSTLVDITNWLTHDLGRPAHLYDTSKLHGNQLVCRKAKTGETCIALDEKALTLAETMSVIADDQSIQAISGIIGGLESSISDTSREIFLEIAVFDPVNIAKTGRHLQIDSDARFRFERGVDHAFAQTGADIASALIIELCGGQASSYVTAGTPQPEIHHVSYNPTFTTQRLGQEIAPKTQLQYLKALGCSIDSTSNSQWQITLPSWRHDLRIAEDISEEIARLYGYNQIQSIAPTPQLGINNQPEYTQLAQFRSVLAAERGLQEAVSFSFCSAKEAQQFLPEGRELIEIANPISADLSVMRPSILPHLLQAASMNHKRGQASVRLFEIGPIFTGSTPGEQHTAIGLLRSGAANPVTPQQDTYMQDVFDIKHDILSLLGTRNLAKNIQITHDAPGFFHPARSGVIRLGKQILAVFGELHPLILKASKLRQRVVAAELYADALPPLKTAKKTARTVYHISDLPTVTRDFAFIISDDIPAANVLKAVRSVDKHIISDVRVFDVYHGEHVADGQYSLALSVSLQPQAQTLTDVEITTLCEAIIQQTSQQCGAVLRDGS